MTTQKQEDLMERLVIDSVPKVERALFMFITKEQSRLYRALEDAYYGAVPEEKLFVILSSHEIVDYFHELLDWERIEKGLTWLRNKGFIDLRYGNLISDIDGTVNANLVMMRAQYWTMTYWRRYGDKATYNVTSDPNDETPMYRIEYVEELPNYG